MSGAPITTVNEQLLAVRQDLANAIQAFSNNYKHSASESSALFNPLSALRRLKSAIDSKGHSSIETAELDQWAARLRASGIQVQTDQVNVGDVALPEVDLSEAKPDDAHCETQANIALMLSMVAALQAKHLELKDVAASDRLATGSGLSGHFETHFHPLLQQTKALLAAIEDPALLSDLDPKHHFHSAPFLLQDGEAAPTILERQDALRAKLEGLPDGENAAIHRVPKAVNFAALVALLAHKAPPSRAFPPSVLSGLSGLVLNSELFPFKFVSGSTLALAAGAPRQCLMEDAAKASPEPVAPKSVVLEVVPEESKPAAESSSTQAPARRSRRRRGRRERGHPVPLRFNRDGSMRLDLGDVFPPEYPAPVRSATAFEHAHSQPGGARGRGRGAPHSAEIFEPRG